MTEKTEIVETRAAFYIGDYPTRLRIKAHEQIQSGLALIKRFKNDPFLLPAEHETTAAHVARIKETEIDRIRRTLGGDKNLCDAAAFEAGLMIDVHDADEISEELTPFYAETDPVLQQRLATRSNFTERTAQFWINAAYVTSAASETAFFEELVKKSHLLIPAVFMDRVLQAEELLETYDKLDLFFEVNEKELAKMAGPQRRIIASSVASDMDYYRDIEGKRTLLGAVTKMAEKKDGSYYHGYRELEKIKSENHGMPLVAHSHGSYFFKQANRYEPIIRQIVYMTIAEPEYAPYTLDAINSAYDTSILSASFKNFVLLNRPEYEPSEGDSADIHAAHDVEIGKLYAQQSACIIGAQKLNNILSFEDVMQEYIFAKHHLEQGKVIAPYQLKNDKKMPTNLLQRDGYDIFTLG